MSFVFASAIILLAKLDELMKLKKMSIEQSQRSGNILTLGLLVMPRSGDTENGLYLGVVHTAASLKNNGNNFNRSINYYEEKKEALGTLVPAKMYTLLEGIFLPG